MPIERNEVIRALTAKGFELEEGTRHTKLRLSVDGKRTSVGTLLSRGTQSRDLGEPMVAAIAREVRLSKAELVRLVECSLSGAAYVELLRGRGILKVGDSGG
jgi:hypothetical protein